MKLNIIVGAFLLFSLNCAFSATPTLSNITNNDLHDIMKDFSTSFIPTSVSGASSYGKVFGFEVGVLGGISNSPAVDRVATESIPKLANASLLFRLDFPKGFGAEINYLPLNIQGFTYNYSSFAGKWTFTDALVFPIDMRLKINYTKADLGFSQSNSTQSANVNYKYNSLAYSLTASKKLLFVEPFVGLGYVSGNNSISATGTMTVFGNSVSASDKSDYKLSSVYSFAGVSFRLLLLNVGLEYMNGFSNSRYNAKISLYF